MFLQSSSKAKKWGIGDRLAKVISCSRMFLVTAATVLLCGCDTVVPTAATFKDTNEILVPFQTSINLSGGNFTVVKPNVVGRDKGFNLLGVIPIRRPKLTAAMDKLYAKANIHDGESKTLSHMIIEHSSSYWILFSRPEITVRADVVQFKTKTKTPESDVLKNDLKPNGGS